MFVMERWFLACASIPMLSDFINLVAWPENFANGIFGSFLFAEFAPDPEAPSSKVCFRSPLSCSS